MKVCIPAKLRKAGKEVITKRPLLHKVKTKGKEEAMRIVNRYKGPVFTDKVGRMKIEAVKLKYEAGVHRVQRVPATETQGRVHTSTATVVLCT